MRVALDQRRSPVRLLRPPARPHEFRQVPRPASTTAPSALVHDFCLLEDEPLTIDTWDTEESS
jgi:hypothetical protein